MSQTPTQYTRQANFITDAGSNPFGQPSPIKLDAEFNAVKNSLDQTQSRLAEIQRDDGAMKDGIVSLDSFIPGFTLPGTLVQLNTITNQHLANNSVGTNQLQALSITSDKLAPNSITAAAIVDGSLTLDKVSGLQSALAGKAATSHTHTKSQITDFSHTHSIGDVNALQAALDAKAATSHSHTKSQVTDFAHTHAVADVTGLQTALDGKQTAGNYATLVGGLVPTSQLPSFVDEVLEYTNTGYFPGSGVAGKIYVALNTNRIYRWSGSAYIELSAPPTTTDNLTEGSVNKYFTSSRASNAAPVQSVAGKTGSVTLVKADVGLSAVDNTSDLNKPVSTAVTTALSAKANVGHTHAIADVTGLQTALDSVSASVTYGTTSGTATEGNDPRISNIKAGSIDTTDGYDGSTLVATGGTIKLNAADGDPTATNGGSISLLGGVDSCNAGGLSANAGSGTAASAGSLNMDGGSDSNGGSILTNGGSVSDSDGGYIWTKGGIYGPGGSIDTSNSGGSISTTFNDLANQPQQINTGAYGGGGVGGFIDTRGVGIGDGGYIQTCGNDEGGPGGYVQTSAGGDGPGGNIDTSDGGGSITTSGYGSIEFGNNGTRTTLSGTASANRSVYLPNSSGTLFLSNDTRISNIEENSIFTADQTTKLLLHGDGANGSTIFTDSSASNVLFTGSGSPILSTSQSKFGASSIYFNGSSYLEADKVEPFEFGASDFTIELWAYRTSGSWNTLISRWSEGTKIFFLGAGDPDSGNSVQFYANNTLLCSGGDPQLNVWEHIAAVRNGIYVKLYLNGTQIGATYTIGTNAINSSSIPFRIGADYDSVNPKLNGYLDEIRISKGIARYQTNFTPPTSPFTKSNPGSLYLSDGGGSIDTRGTGSVQLGITGTRTTLVGSASGSNKTITLPNATGTGALTDQSTGKTSSSYIYSASASAKSALEADGSGGCAFVAPRTVTVVKSADENKSSNANMTISSNNDSELTASVTAGNIYRIDVRLEYTAAILGGLNAGIVTGTTNVFVATSGACGTCSRNDNTIRAFYIATATGSSVAQLTFGGDGNSSAATNGVWTASGVFRAQNSGTLTLRWSQQTSNATATTLKANSSLTLTKLN